MNAEASSSTSLHARRCGNGGEVIECPARSRRRTTQRQSLTWSVAILIAPLLTQAGAESIQPRWGQASVLAGSHFVVQGGYTNAGNGGGYTFTSGQSTGDTMALDLSQPFSTSTAPWKTLNSSGTPPSVAFHSLSVLKGQDQLMAFGGEGASSSASPMASDSASLASIDSNAGSVTWTLANSSWAQPPRRIFQAADCDDKGNVWIVGGQRDDGSGIDYDEAWTIDASVSNARFSQMPKPASGLVGATASYLSDDRLAVLGGLAANGSLASFQSISTFSLSGNQWQTTSTAAGTAGFPAARRNHIAVTLPNKRIFIQGGADATLLTAMSDAWILDWGEEPPRWSQMTEQNGPGARFGHSAVAYGNKIAVAFGWAGNNAADSQVYVFDASKLTSNADGSSSGGSWTASYTPDPSASSGSAGAATTPSSSQSNGSSSSDGSSSESSGAAEAGPSRTSSASSSSKSVDGLNPTTGHGSNDAEQFGTGAKAATAVGCFLALGAIIAVGIYFYRRRSNNYHNWKGDDGNDGLLHDPKHYSGAGAFAVGEKDLELGNFEPRIHPGGVRPPISPGNDARQPVWSGSNVGHAFEGSGPHLRHRLALMTGFGLGVATTQPHRFNMLADEDEDDDPLNARSEESHTNEGSPALLSVSNAEHFAVQGRHNSRQRRALAGSSAAIVEACEADLMMSPASATSDFSGQEDESARDRAASKTQSGGSALLARNADRNGILADNASILSSRESLPGQETRDIVSFSDAHGTSHHKRTSDSSCNTTRIDESPLIRRSPTWWDRFMAQSFLERSRSGRLSTGPNADAPIRDPAEPPQLGTIKELATPLGRENPFDDPKEERSQEEGDERLKAGLNVLHDRSTSSLQTASSSVLETRVRNMDVVQRTGTISTRRSASPSRISRASTRSKSLSQSARLTRQSSLNDPLVATHDRSLQSSQTSVEGMLEKAVLHPQHLDATHISTIVDEDEEGETSMLLGYAEDSRDIADANLGFFRPNKEVDKEIDADFKPQLRHYEAQEKQAVERLNPRHARLGSIPRQRNVSEAPSMTPSTTKRARQNPELISPYSPEPARTSNPPLQGSVLERVQAIERKWSEEGCLAVLPVPRSPATSLQSSCNESDQSPSAKSADKTSAHASAGHAKYTHGLVPKPQLFVANPDRRSRASSSGG